jgi:hypothetical protein
MYSSDLVHGHSNIPYRVGYAGRIPANEKLDILSLFKCDERGEGKGEMKLQEKREVEKMKMKQKTTTRKEERKTG